MIFPLHFFGVLRAEFLIFLFGDEEWVNDSEADEVLRGTQQHCYFRLMAYFFRSLVLQIGPFL